MRQFLTPFVLLAGLAATSPAQQVGTVRFPISCAPETQAPFNRGVAYLHSFAYPQAIESFNAVLAADSACAIAWWGKALAAWGNPFAAGIKSPAQLQRGLAAVRSGRAAGKATERERGYLEAAAQLYEHSDSVGQPDRLHRFRDAMAALVAREPADTEARIFHALALAISADPADKTYASQLAAGATLESLFARLPDHPGLAHYIIHSYDVPPLAPRAEHAAERYSRIAPQISHALHMPSHTYTRTGEWDASIVANVASAGAARREHSGAEELHAADYRAYAYLQLGRDSAARVLLDSLPALAALFDPNAQGVAAPPMAGYYALAAIPARWALERGAWAAAARLPLVPSPTAFATATTWFARGLGAARSGDAQGAAAAVSALAALRDTLTARQETYWNEQVEIQRMVMEAWREFAAGDGAAALTTLRAAADREDATEKNAITPGPIAPARELLGEMLLLRHEPQAALAEFAAALTREPNRLRTLAGALRAAREVGNQAEARRYSGLLGTSRLAALARRP